MRRVRFTHRGKPEGGLDGCRSPTQSLGFRRLVGQTYTFNIHQKESLMLDLGIIFIAIVVVLLFFQGRTKFYKDKKRLYSGEYIKKEVEKDKAETYSGRILKNSLGCLYAFIIAFFLLSGIIMICVGLLQNNPK
jgi:hypothetical protein